MTTEAKLVLFDGVVFLAVLVALEPLITQAIADARRYLNL